MDAADLVAPATASILESNYGMAPFQPPGGGSGATQITYTNRVWDTQAGPGFVRWDTVDASDPAGVSYPGPGTFGVHTSDFCVEYSAASTVP